MNANHQRLIDLLDFSRRAPTARRNEQLKTYLKTHPLPAFIKLNKQVSLVTPLFWAIHTTAARYAATDTKRERFEVLRKTIDILLQAGAKIDTPSHGRLPTGAKTTMNPLFKTVVEEYMGDEEGSYLHLIEFLLKRGADPNNAVSITTLRTYSQRTFALHVTARGNLESTRLLVKYGANVDARDDNGSTPIFDPARKNNPEMVKFLLRAGASAKLTDKHGNTPLHVLFMDSRRNLSEPGYRERFFKTVRLLMDHGANPRRKNKEGKTPVDLAEKFDAPDRVRIFVILKEKNRATARHALNKHLPNNVVQQILHRAGLTNVNELQGKRRNQETRRNRRLVKRRRT